MMHTLVALWAYGNQDLLPSHWNQGMMAALGAFLDMTEERYHDIMSVYRSSGTDVQKKLLSDYYRARCLDLARQSCLPLLLALDK